MTINNCFLASGNTTVNKKTVEEFALIYKGEAIAKGTKADFQKQIKEIGKNIHNEKRLVETLETMFENGGIPFLKGYNREKIVSIPKGKRPKPSVYLPKEYIVTHLKKFKEGASYLVPKSALDKYGRNIIGRADGQFVMSSKEMDELLISAQGDISYIEKELGIPSGWWKDTELVRIDIKKPFDLKIRLPNGNESGANDLWLPGGKLPTGYLESVIDAIPKNYYKEINLKLK